MVRSNTLARSAWWSESRWPVPGVRMMSTSSPWSRKNPSSRATSSGRSWIAFIMEALTFFMAAPLPPGAVVDGVLVGGAGHRHVPLHGPVVGIVEALARVRLRRGMKQAPDLELVRLQEPAGLADEVVDERRRVFFDELDRPRLRAEHLVERRAVEVVAGGF